MVRRFTGEEVATVLIDNGYYPQDRTGSHLKLRYEHPETDEVRTVTVPLHGEIATGTLRNIARQCGANDFEKFRSWIDRNR
ncbi:type II toxin-antitoxin system HicA family toxin [Halococcus qingdaonensis]|uniref:type II toxin-antitoxin system HicA family toxin n=1 Tax=Halococcus qingdaonensis TaxID=224402 RepID=UPI002117018D|nr:type II toxin-antitoxin system HicA family toxin [Halococcus qingdaonensis]